MFDVRKKVLICLQYYAAVLAKTDFARTKASSVKAAEGKTPTDQLNPPSLGPIRAEMAFVVVAAAVDIPCSFAHLTFVRRVPSKGVFLWASERFALLR